MRSIAGIVGLLSVLANAIALGSSAVSQSALFTRVTGEVRGSRLAVAVETAIAGEVTLGVIDVAGDVIQPDGARPVIDLDGVPEPDRALVRLRFRGAGGRREEARLWLGDFQEAKWPTISVRGPRTLPIGEPLRLRIDVTRASGEPIPNVAIVTQSAQHEIEAKPDDTGSAWIVFPPTESDRLGVRRVTVHASNADFDRRLTAAIEITPRPRSVLVETDRPSYRPGGTVQVRVFALDGISHRAIPGEAVDVTVSDPQGRTVARHPTTTGDFGVRVVTVPLSLALAEGRYSIRASAPRPGADAGVDTATRGFTVEERVATRPRVAVTPATPKPPAVEHTAPPPITLHAPARTAPGATFPVSFHSARSTGTVHFDLCSNGRLVGGASARLDRGRASATVSVPGAFRGPAVLVARMSDEGDRARACRRIDVVTSPLDIALVADRTRARPGEPVVCTAQVRDPSGKGIPALLDVRGIDRVYREAAGAIVSPFDREPAPERWDERPVILAHRGAVVERARVAVEARRAAEPAMRDARLSVGSGRAIDARLPWGGAIRLARRGASYVLCGEPAVTMTPTNVSAPIYPGPIAAIHPERTTHRPEAAPLPTHSDAAPAAAPAEGMAGDAWLHGFQSHDGAFPVLVRGGLLDLAPDEAPGDPRLEPGTTGLILLAYLGAGYTDQRGRHRHRVGRALAYLGSIQREDGFLGDPDAPWAFLNHAMCTLALVEASGMTGAPALAKRATDAMRALAERQRADGSFAEAGFEDASLVLVGWASLVLHASARADLTAPAGVRDRLARWVEAHTDPRTGRLPAGVDEVERYPFSGTESARTSAALTAMIRILLFDEGPLPRVVATLLADLPTVGDRDLHGVWWATMAMFQVGGGDWKRWNKAMKGAVVDAQIRGGGGRGLWRADADTGRVATSAWGILCLEIYYRYGEVFGSPGPASARVRTHFPDLLIADLARRTTLEGRAELRLPLPDSITDWEIRVGAWDGRGGYGVAQTTVRATLPLHVDADLPPRLRVGDRIDLRVRVRSTLDRDAAITLRVARATGFAIARDGPVDATVPAGGTVAVPITLDAVRPGAATIRLAVAGGGHRDALERATTILPLVGPDTAAARVRCSHPLRPGASFRPGDVLPPDATAIRGRLRVTADPLGEATAGLDALIRRPTGCFEQTAATLYPAILALRYLNRTGRANGEVETRAKRHLLLGYQAVIGCEVEGGGFSLYGDEPARPDLTALALHLLTDLAAVPAVAPSIDRDVVTRAVTFLRAHRPEDLATRVYATAAFARSGDAVDAKDSVGVALERKDAYAAALAACHGLVAPADASRVRALLQSTVETWRGRASWAARTPTLFTGGTISSRTEMTAVAVGALNALGGSASLVDRGLMTIRRAMNEDGAWDTTRETVVCLRALLATASPTAAAGVLIVKRAGRPDQRVSIGGASDSTNAGAFSAILDLGPLERDERIEAVFNGRGSPTIVCAIEARSKSSKPDAGSLAITATWDREVDAPGASTTCDLRVRNRRVRPVHAPHVTLPIPAGFRPDLATLRGDGAPGLARAEIKAGHVHLYLYRLSQGDAVRLCVPFVASAAGRFHTGTTRAWPYYAPDESSTAVGVQIRVNAPR